MATFAITYDYLCPFARIANESLVEAMADGADHEVTFPTILSCSEPPR